MKAIAIDRWGGPDVLMLRDVPRPVAGIGEVLVQVHYAALNPIDFKIRNGRFRWFMSRRFPKIPGLEASGVVVATGGGVTDISVGSRVFIQTSRRFRMGCYAEFAIAEADRCLLLDENDDMQVCSSLAVAPVTALQCLRDHGRVREGSRVLINGASGSVGRCAVQIARMMGADVTAVCSTRNLDLVLRDGAHRVIDYTTTSVAETEEQYDLILDCVSTLRFSACQKVLKPQGVFVNLMLRPADLLWQKISNPFRKQQFLTALMDYRPDDLQWILRQLRRGALHLPLDRMVSLEEAADAHRYIETGRATGKVLLSTGQG